MINEQFLYDFTKLLMKIYFVNPNDEDLGTIFDKFSPEFVLIGTGKFEYFQNLEETLIGIQEIRDTTGYLNFEILDEWYKCVVLSPEIYFMHGEIKTRQVGSDEIKILMEIDTRFSILYRINGDSFEILHIHHSIPDPEQQNGEHYPKSLSQQAHDALKMAELFQQKAEMDLMTQIYNKESFKIHVENQIKNSTKGTMLLFDLDYFKIINDTYGHIMGDEILKLLATLLKESFSSNAFIGRMGGDEFFVFDYGNSSKDEIIQQITLICDNFKSKAKVLLNNTIPSYSVGIASFDEPKYSYGALLRNADHALYHAKNIGRDTYHWHV